MFDRCSQTRLEARPQRKTSLKKIGKHFMKILGHFVCGGQCIRKRGKLTSKQKEIEDHNNKTGNVKCSWKFYEELTACVAKDATVTPVCTMESNLQVDDHNSVRYNSGHQSDEESSSESISNKARSRSPVGEMFNF